MPACSCSLQQSPISAFRYDEYYGLDVINCLGYVFKTSVKASCHSHLLARITPLAARTPRHAPWPGGYRHPDPKGKGRYRGPCFRGAVKGP